MCLPVSIRPTYLGIALTLDDRSVASRRERPMASRKAVLASPIFFIFKKLFHDRGYSVFNALSIFVIVKFRGPVPVMALDTNRLVVDFPTDGQGSLVVGVVFVSAPRSVTSFTLNTAEFRRDLFAHKSLGFTVAGRMTFEAIRIVAHSTQAGKGVGMGVLFPLFEIFEMTQPAFAVPDVIGRVTGKNVKAAREKRTGQKRNGQCDKQRDKTHLG
jgi:hypothetical protein